MASLPRSPHINQRPADLKPVEEVTLSEIWYKRSSNPQTVVVVAVTGGAIATNGRAEHPRIVVPGPTANDTVFAIPGCPGRTVRRRTAIIVMVAVLRPL